MKGLRQQIHQTAKGAIETAEVASQPLNDLLCAEELATELHNCHLDAWRDYASMGKSAEMWHRFRMQIARDLLERVNVTRKSA